MAKPPICFPPPHGRTRVGKDGRIEPVMEPVFVACGQVVTLRGIGEVICTRRQGHPVRLDFAHSNGYVEWCFDGAARGEDGAK